MQISTIFISYYFLFLNVPFSSILAFCFYCVFFSLLLTNFSTIILSFFHTQNTDKKFTLSFSKLSFKCPFRHLQCRLALSLSLSHCTIYALQSSLFNFTCQFTYDASWVSNGGSPAGRGLFIRPEVRFERGVRVRETRCLASRR